MSRIIPALLVLAGIWGLAMLVVSWAKSSTPTPESVATFVAAHPLADVDNAERDKRLRAVADQLNRLDFEQRRELRNSPQFEAFTTQMTESEMSLFLDMTLPEGFRQMMLALNAMTPERRKQIVDRALAELQENGVRAAPQLESDANTRKIVDQGMTAFYEEANIDVKLDFAPLIEEMQRSLQGGR